MSYTALYHCVYLRAIVTDIKRPRRLLTIPEFLKRHPEISDHALRYALRNRDANGLAPHVYRHYGTRGLILDAPGVVAWFNRVVPA